MRDQSSCEFFLQPVQTNIPTIGRRSVLPKPQVIHVDRNSSMNLRPVKPFQHGRYRFLPTVTGSIIVFKEIGTDQGANSDCTQNCDLFAERLSNDGMCGGSLAGKTRVLLLAAEVRFLFSMKCCSSNFLMTYFTVDALTVRRCNRLNAPMVSTRDR